MPQGSMTVRVLFKTRPNCVHIFMLDSVWKSIQVQQMSEQEPGTSVAANTCLVKPPTQKQNVAKYTI